MTQSYQPRQPRARALSSNPTRGAASAAKVTAGTLSDQLELTLTDMTPPQLTGGTSDPLLTLTDMTPSLGSMALYP